MHQAQVFASSVMQQMQQMQQLQQMTLQVLRSVTSGAPLPAIGQEPAPSASAVEDVGVVSPSAERACRRLASQLALPASSSVPAGGFPQPADADVHDPSTGHAAAVKTDNGQGKEDGIGFVVAASDVPEKQESVGGDAGVGVRNRKTAKRSVQEVTDCIVSAMIAKGEAADKRSKKEAAAAKIDKKQSDKRSQKEEAAAKPPTFSVERSRSQVLLRTGLAGKGQNITIKFASVKGGEKQAIGQAKRWVAEQRKLRGLD